MTTDRNEHSNRNRKCFYDDKTNSDWYIESYDNSCHNPIKIVKAKDHKEEDEDRCCKPEACCYKPMHDKKEEVPCCCKDALKKSLRILFNPLIRPLITANTFQLVGDNFNTGNGSLSGFSSCGDGTITLTPPTSAESPTIRTTFCDLIFIAFTLNNPAALATFTELLLELVPTIDPTKLCCKTEKGCCCNTNKAILLADLMGQIDVGFNTSALTPSNIIANLEVLTVTKDVVWLVENPTSTPRILVACLNGIYSITA